MKYRRKIHIEKTYTLKNLNIDNLVKGLVILESRVVERVQIAREEEICSYDSIYYMYVGNKIIIFDDKNNKIVIKNNEQPMLGYQDIKNIFMPIYRDLIRRKLFKPKKKQMSKIRGLIECIYYNMGTYIGYNIYIDKYIYDKDNISIVYGGIKEHNALIYNDKTLINLLKYNKNISILSNNNIIINIENLKHCLR